MGQGANIVSEMKLAQIRLEHKAELPWFLLAPLEVTIAAVASPNRSITALPAGFLRWDEEEPNALYITYDGGGAITSSTAIAFKSSAELQSNTDYLGYATSPSYWSYVGRNLILLPNPTVGAKLRIASCYQADVSLDTDATTNNWLTHTPDLLILETALKFATRLRDAELTNLLSRDLVEARNDMLAFSEAHRLTGGEYYKGAYNE